MSDYDPNLGPGRPGYDPLNRQADPYRAPDDGRPGYVLLAVLAGVALVGGFLYFGNPQNSIGSRAGAGARAHRADGDGNAGHAGRHQSGSPGRDSDAGEPGGPDSGRPPGHPAGVAP